MELRIPFEKAIRDRRLLKGRWEQLSLPQQVALKSLYGLPLASNEEKRIWSAQQGFAIYDDLGYTLDLKKELDYSPRKFREAWMVVGRRGGKTDRFASTIMAYESCFGGHEQYVSRGQPAYCFQIAQDMRNAASALHFIFATIEESPAGSELLAGPPVSDAIRLTNGIVIRCLPCTLKATRGFATAVVVLDEVGVWYQESDSANPDYEIYRAVKPGQMQFPNALTVGISSPYNKQGLLYKFYEAGTQGRNAKEFEKKHFRNVLVVHSPTASMGNPLVTRESLEDERDSDPKAFERECLAEFQDSLSGFLDAKLIRRAVDSGVFEREPTPSAFSYVAAIDPAFRHDAFALSIFHIDEEGNVVQDVIRRWKADHFGPVNPDAVLREISHLLQEYGIASVYSDQYHLESLQTLAVKHGFVIEGVAFKATNKAAIYGSLQQLLNQGRLRLLDNPECLKELRQLERRLSQGGVVQIAAPQGAYDDLATVTALCAVKCLYLLPRPTEALPNPEPSVNERILAQIQRNKAHNQLLPLGEKYDSTLPTWY